jgi:hypothetical protein
VAPAERQAKIIAREIARQLRNTQLIVTRSTLTEIELSNGARVIALPSTSDTIRGFSAVSLLIIDEAIVPEGGERAMLGFETITLAPIDLRLIEPKLLGPDHIAWLNRYHARVYEALYPLLGDETREWLEEATAEVK